MLNMLGFEKLKSESIQISVRRYCSSLPNKGLTTMKSSFKWKQFTITQKCSRVTNLYQSNWLLYFISSTVEKSLKSLELCWYFSNRQMNRSRFIETNFLKKSLQLIFFWIQYPSRFHFYWNSNIYSFSSAKM